MGSGDLPAPQSEMPFGHDQGIPSPLHKPSYWAQCIRLFLVDNFREACTKHTLSLVLVHPSTRPVMSANMIEYWNNFILRSRSVIDTPPVTLNPPTEEPEGAYPWGSYVSYLKHHNNLGVYKFF